MNFRSEVGGEAQHTDPPGGSLVPPHKILKVVGRIYACCGFLCITLDKPTQLVHR